MSSQLDGSLNKETGAVETAGRTNTKQKKLHYGNYKTDNKINHSYLQFTLIWGIANIAKQSWF